MRTAYLVIGLSLVFSWRSFCSEILFLGSAAARSADETNLQIAAGFYGVTVNTLRLNTADDRRAIAAAVQRSQTIAVVIAANSLGSIDQKNLFQMILRRPGTRLPLLILGAGPNTDTTLIANWSNGAAVGFEQLRDSRESIYRFNHVDEWTAQLSNLQVSSSPHSAGYFLLSSNSNVQPVLSIQEGRQFFPVFIETLVRGLQVFLASSLQDSSPVRDDSSDHLLDAFVQIAPVMIFIRHCAGEKGWRFPNHYANLTIDDPWLREPYGHFSYRGLLAEMEKHNFHSTVAFIPWNYDRSEPKVVSLIRTHPDRFSICIHGNNHDHKEFTDYRSKPLAGQIDALKQALARMDEFRKQTGIPYDRVMVFPHSIAPENTLAVLKTYNFLGTINSSNVPMDRLTPPLLSFSLRPVTMSFGDFPSLRRNPAPVPVSKSFIAINAFLGNPLLFYCHQNYFADGIDRFDLVADSVNDSQPGTQWRSLGDIIRHLYLLKRRDDGEYDVFAFSRTLSLTNPSDKESVFYIRIQEHTVPSIESVNVDGRHVPYSIENGYLYFRTTLPAGRTRTIAIEYRNDLAVPPMSVSKQSTRVYLLRTGSDFRDTILSRSSVGRAIIWSYVNHKITPAHVVICMGIVMLFGICILFGIRAIGNKRHQSDI
jgi:hypothetical protein